MVSNVYLSDAAKAGRFLMRRADMATRRHGVNPTATGRPRTNSWARCSVITLLLVSIVGAVTCVWLVSSNLGEQADASLFKSVSKLRRRPLLLPTEPLARAGEEGLAAGGRAKSRPAADPALSRRRTIVLYTEGGRINTGVWPNWDGESRAVLNWAAAGVVVDKGCPVSCLITQDNSYVDKADMVVVETVNHPKFGLAGMAFEWPPPGKPNPRLTAMKEGRVDGAPLTDHLGRELTVPDTLPAVGVFYYEPDSQYPGWTASAPAIQERTHFTAVAHADATLPMTLVCPWGKAVHQYLQPPPRKLPGRLLAYFSEHGVSPRYSKIVDELFQAAGEKLHAFSHRQNRQVPAEAGGDPFQLSKRLEFVSSYRFLLVTDGQSQDDFLSPEWSQVFLAGTVPIYGGAPNAKLYAPGPRSFLSLDDFTSGRELWEYIRAFDEGEQGAGEGGASSSAAIEAAYARFFSWKRGARRAYEADEGGFSYSLGTGDGVAPGLDAVKAGEAMDRWARPAAPGPSHGQQREADGDEGSEGSEGSEGEDGGAQFGVDSHTVWRYYRRHLDRCVHYAECRLCDLAHKIT